MELARIKPYSFQTAAAVDVGGFYVGEKSEITHRTHRQTQSHIIEVGQSKNNKRPTGRNSGGANFYWSGSKLSACRDRPQREVKEI